VKDAIRCTAHLLDREDPDSRREYADDPGDGVEQEVALVQADPKPDGDRVAYGGVGGLGYHLERLATDLSCYRLRAE
jgi:hypothetical protein